MFGKLIIFAIVAVLIYSIFIRTKSRLANAPIENKRQHNQPERKGLFNEDVKISKIHLIITFLAALYLIWAVITLYR